MIPKSVPAFLCRLLPRLVTIILLLSHSSGTAQLLAQDAGVPKEITGSVSDFSTGDFLPSRLYLQNLDTMDRHIVTSADPAGSAVEYSRQIGKTASVEIHTTLSAHPFKVTLAPGRYRIRAEHGKEFVPAEVEFTVGEKVAPVELKLRRFVDMAHLGWYSGDTHVHRTMKELPNLVLAEDLNVSLPLNYWVRDSTEIPSASGPALDPEVIDIDSTHLIYPINTEYEIFTVKGQRHTQGAVFVLNHKTPLNIATPPALPVAEEARRQGAILDLDKHSWAWSMMIVPVMNVDLFELANNHNWRTQFGFPQWTIENAPDWPEVERNGAGFTELGWTEFAMQTYYALLNCGLRMRVTGGTGAGVHPVPLGHGRVYVHTGPDFSYQRWIEELNAGHSFVTTGPLMDVRFNDSLPGTTWKTREPDNAVSISGRIITLNPLKFIEIIRNGVIASRLEIVPAKTEEGAWEYVTDGKVNLSGSGWVALRCFEDLPNDKVSFAHTNPVFMDVEDRPLVPRRRDADFFVRRIDEEIARNSGVLSEEALGEYRQAREYYQAVLERAQD